MPDSFRLVENPDPRTWDAFICAHNGHLLQSSAWGELKARFGWSATRLALERDGKPCAAAQILFRHLPLGQRLAYVPRGPVVDPSDEYALASLLQALTTTARAHGAFALKVEPNWLDDQFAGGFPALLRSWRPGSSHQTQLTMHLDLTRELDAILAQMKPKWRYNIRLSQRKGVSVRTGTMADLPLFYQLLQVTSSRDHFGIHTLAYYRAAFDLLRDHARLFVAEFQGEPLAAIFATVFGAQAIYLYGASSNEHREVMPNYALHWTAIQWARACGCTNYDLWGIADQGLYQFKHGFGGNVVRYVGAFDKVFSPVRFALYRKALAFRRGGLG